MDSKIFLSGISHWRTPLVLREKLALNCAPRDFLRDANLDLMDKGNGLQELAIISTCNRVEILMVASDPEIAAKVRSAWLSAAGESVSDLQDQVYTYEEKDAVSHFFRVVSSLDSLVLGEPQILGQVKKAYRQALNQGCTRLLLNKLFHKAFFTAKRIRTNTEIGAKPISIASAAIHMAEGLLRSLKGKTVLLLGSGEMAELAAAHFTKAGAAPLLIVSRTLENAKLLAAKFNGESFDIEELDRALARADIVFASAGSPQPLVKTENIKRSTVGKEIKSKLFIDIAVPRNIDPEVGKLDNIYLYDLDDIQQEVQKNTARRSEAEKEALSVIEEETRNFLDWRKSLALKPTIVELLDRTQKIADAELAKTLKRIGPVDPEVEDALRRMLKAVVKKINHEPISFIKRVQQNHGSGIRYVEILRNFFNLNRK